MEDFKHLDIEKVSTRHIEEWLKIARLQGQWTATKSLQHQAELLGTEGAILEQFKVALRRIEERLPTPAGSVVATQADIAVTDMLATDSPSQVEDTNTSPKSSPKGKGADTGEGNHGRI